MAPPPGDPPAPVRLSAGGPRAPAWELSAELVAIHGGAGEGDPVASLDGGRVTVHERERLTGRAASGAGAGPVYRLGPGGAIVVPSGRVLVRYPRGEPVESHRDQLAEAGYDLEQVLGFAPHAGWIRPRSGSIADALSGIEQVRGLPGVEHVEPEGLMEISGRGAAPGR